MAPQLHRPLAMALRACSIASLSAFGALAITAPLAAAAVDASEAGRAEIVASRNGSAQEPSAITEGGLDTAFSLRLPDGAACSGDSTNGGYRVQSFMVPNSVDPRALTFGANGPRPPAVGAAFRQPLYMVSTKSYVNAATNLAERPGGPGVIINIPDFHFGVFEPAELPPGRYLVGIACTKGPESEDQLDRYWATEMDVGAAAGPAPGGLSGGAGGAGWRAISDPPEAVTGPPDATVVPTGPHGNVAGQGPTPEPASAPAAAIDDQGTSSAAADRATLTVDLVATPPLTGGPPSFHLPAVRIASSLSVAGSTSDSLLLWLATAALTGRTAFLLTRRPVLATPSER